MKYKYNIKTLTQYQYDVLNYFAAKTGCDCWFDIRQRKRDALDYVYDTEERKKYCLRTGIKYLIEALDDPDIYVNCAPDYMQEFALWDLCRYLEIELPYYMQPEIQRGISSENLITLLQEDHIDYDVPGDDDAIHCQDYVFQFDRDGMLFDIVNLFYVEVR
jgi:hypothetical protein